MLALKRIVIGLTVLATLSCKPGEGKMAGAVFHECIRNGDVTLSQFIKNPEILRHGRLEDFERILLAEDQRFEVLPLAEYLSTPKPECEVCRAIEYDDFRHVVWRSSEDDGVFRRFRLYINGGDVACVETDFGYKNPY